MSETNPTPTVLLRSKDEVALDLMKFVVETTGYAKSTSGAGFSGKGARHPEEHTEALLKLYDRCRRLVHTEAKGK